MRIRTAEAASRLRRIESLSEADIQRHDSRHVNDLVEVGLLRFLRWLVPEGGDLHGLDELEGFGAVPDNAIGDRTDGFAGDLLADVRVQCAVGGGGQDADVEDWLGFEHLLCSCSRRKDDSGKMRSQLCRIPVEDGRSHVRADE